MNKVILVTGGSSGIGRAIASHLASLGHEVYGTSRKVSSGTQLDNFTLVQMDVTDEKSVVNAIEYVRDQSKRLDVLVNNAGLGMAGPIESTSNAEVREIYETNVMGLLNSCRHAIPLIRSGGGGHIINVTSIGGLISLPFRGIYCSSKYAVEGITETLSMELKRDNIKVSIIEPGDFKTNINSNRRVVKLIDDEVYGEDFARTLAQINEEVSSAPTPEPIARKVAEIIQMDSPRLRYKVATFQQRLSVVLKRFTPDRFFENLIMKFYKLKQ